MDVELTLTSEGECRRSVPYLTPSELCLVFSLSHSCTSVSLVTDRCACVHTPNVLALTQGPSAEKCTSHLTSRDMSTACGVGVADLLAKGERHADHYTKVRNSSQRPSHQRPQHNLQTNSNDTFDAKDTDNNTYTCDVFDMSDGEQNAERARPHHIMDGSPVISWRHFLQAQSKLKPGRAVWYRWNECRGAAMFEHAGKHPLVVHPQCSVSSSITVI